MGVRASKDSVSALLVAHFPFWLSGDEGPWALRACTPAIQPACFAIKAAPMLMRLSPPYTLTLLALLYDGSEQRQETALRTRRSLRSREVVTEKEGNDDDGG